MKIRVNDLGTFIRNGWYHFDEEAELNLLGPRNNDESGWRMMEQCHLAAVRPRAATTANDDIYPTSYGGTLI